MGSAVARRRRVRSSVVPERRRCAVRQEARTKPVPYAGRNRWRSSALDLTAAGMAVVSASASPMPRRSHRLDDLGVTTARDSQLLGAVLLRKRAITRCDVRECGAYCCGGGVFLSL